MSNATITRDGESHEFPLKSGTLGPSAVNISTLYRDAGIFTYDLGFMATASCLSAITYIDNDRAAGPRGTSTYRGTGSGRRPRWS